MGPLDCVLGRLLGLQRAQHSPMVLELCVEAVARLVNIQLITFGAPDVVDRYNSALTTVVHWVLRQAKIESSLLKVLDFI